MDTTKAERIRDTELQAALNAIAAAPVPVVGPDPTDDAIALVAPEASRAELRTLREHVDNTRARYTTELANREAVPRRMAALRTELAVRGLAGFLVPRADEHQSEYIPLGSQRLAWITGFSGSAGLAIVLADAATVIVDGRYTLQVRDQVDDALFEIRHVSKEPLDTWIAERLPAGSKLGYDPWHFTARRLEMLAKACRKAGGELVAVETNPVDAVWIEQPPAPISPAVPHPIEFAGEAHANKRARVAAKLAKEGTDAAVLTAPDSIAWLLNVRGADVPNTPLPLSFAMLAADGMVDWFIDGRKLSDGIRDHLGDGVRVRQVTEFGPALDAYDGRTVLADPASAPVWVIDRLQAAGAQALPGKDPCQLPKACKNETELAGVRSAHVRDGAALTRFLAWLAREAPLGAVDELSAQARLAELRAEGDRFRGLAFDTISGAGPNGAIVHYRAGTETNRVLESGTLYLVDSGGQYLDGTTDVTRTVAIGDPTAEMRDRFTRVLRGHIALAMARFPEGTTGPQLDTLARAPLWSAGLDFDHGTGHGVGAYLGVHEGPQGIASTAAQTAFRPGMIVSNEPGYYLSGQYGIRIENLVTVIAAGMPEGGESKLLALETLTLAPIDRNLVDPEMLTRAEIGWLDRYHARVRKTLSPLVDSETSDWLDSATAPLNSAAL